MTDPLSISAALVGLTFTALHLTHKLVTFTKSTKDAPKQAQTVLAEVRDLQGIIMHCKELILMDNPSASSSSRRAGASMVLVDHVVVVLSGCVMTFSELEVLLGKLNVEGDLDMLDCVKWARKEEKIAMMVGRLQNHKASLTAILAVLGCSNQFQANESLDRLNASVEQLVAAHQDLFGRISEIELRQGVEHRGQPSLDSVNAPTPTKISDQLLLKSTAEYQNETTSFDLQFEPLLREDLASSRVYRRAFKDGDQHSLISDATRATPWSLLSGMSLANVSVISIIALPIFSSLIANSQRYDFADLTSYASGITVTPSQKMRQKQIGSVFIMKLESYYYHLVILPLFRQKLPLRT